VFSEASGAESSPALTEASDIPDDTPDMDRFGDLNMGTITPSKVDKSYRYGKNGYGPKRHTAGRGEIARSQRDLPTTDLLRKRKRHNQDKDVGNVRRHASWENGEDSASDSDAGQIFSQTKSHKPPKQKSWLKNMFAVMDEHPNAPENLYRWIQLLVNFLLVSIFFFVGWAIVDTVRSDIRNANEAARLEIVSKVLECREEYVLNGCAKKDRPALKQMCDEWYDCMNQDPESIMRVKVTAKHVAEIINEFANGLHLKAWVSYHSGAAWIV
jgi:hypothetical protein